MRLTVEELPNRIQAVNNDQLPSLILINGNETLLIEEALDQIRTVLRERGFAERLSYQLEAGFDWTVLNGAGQSMSLFSERQLIEFRVPKSLGVQGSKFVSELCGQPPSDDLLIIIMPWLDKRQRNAKWAKLVEASAWLVDCAEIKSYQFPAWLKTRLQSRALRIESGVLEVLAAQLEGNVLAAAQEIEKLKVLSDNGAVSLELVKSSLADQAQFDVYELVDVCLKGDLARATRILSRLNSEGVEPVIVVWALAREIRHIVALKEEIEGGLAATQAFKKLRIWSSREALYKSVLSRFTRRDIGELMKQVTRLDCFVKGQASAGEINSVWYQIERQCTAVCGFQPIREMNYA